MVLEKLPSPVPRVPDGRQSVPDDIAPDAQTGRVQDTIMTGMVLCSCKCDSLEYCLTRRIALEDLSPRRPFGLRVHILELTMCSVHVCDKTL